MAADFIDVNRTKQPGNMMVRCADLLCELSDTVAKMKNIKDHCNAAGDFSKMEAVFGLNVGAGANAAALIDNLNTLLNSATDVLGATRAAQLLEYKSRLSGQ